MKTRFLVALLLLWGVSAQAAEAPAKGCQIQIGEDWIAMGATTVPSCLKFAAAAATPGETQFAEFNGMPLSYKDGKYYQSRDNGKNWQRLDIDNNGGTPSSLNVLRTGSDVAAGASAKSQPAPPAPPVAPAPAPVKAKKEVAKQTIPAPVSVPVPAPAQGPVQADALADAAAASQKVLPIEASPSSASTEFPEPDSAASAVPSLDAIAAAPVGATTVSESSNSASAGNSAVSGCQVRVSKMWQVTPVASLRDCGRLLTTSTIKNKAASGQAYWNGSYLFYSNNQLYRSADGQSWQLVKP